MIYRPNSSYASRASDKARNTGIWIEIEWWDPSYFHKVFNQRIKIPTVTAVTVPVAQATIAVEDALAVALTLMTKLPADPDTMYARL